MTNHPVYETDISPPSLGNHLVRTPLLNQLKNAPKKLTLIQAPPGYGKTALLTQIRNAYRVASVWINLRDTDNDPVNFIHKLNAAIAQTYEDPGSTQHPQQLGGLAPPSFVPWIRSFVAEMNQHPAFHVYLNDVDFVSSRMTLELIESLIQGSRHNVRFFATATKPIDFSYANLLIENQVASINQEALRFGNHDTQAYYAIAQGKQLEDKTAAELTSLCEGWPAAISFAVNTLADENEVAHFIGELSTIQQAFDRYFIERIFEKQSDAQQQLMLRLSLLDRFNLSISQLLSDNQEDSAAFAKHLKNHTFITPIDAAGKWYRFHQLFHLFLKNRCEESLSIRERNQWQIKSAHWFAENDLVEEAIHLAIKADDSIQAAKWMEQAFSVIVVGLGKHVTYANWFEALSAETVEQSPRARIGFIWSLTARRQYLAVAEQMQWLLKHKDRYGADIQQEIDRTTSLMLCAMKGLQDDAKGCDPLITQWLEKWNRPELYHQQRDYHYEVGLAHLLKGFCDKCLSHFNSARFALNEALSHFDAYGTYYGKTWAQSLLAVTYAKQGFHHEAKIAALEGYQNAKEHLGENSHSGYGLAALLAAIHYEHDELDLARRYLKDCLESLKEQSSTDLLTAAYETNARLLMHSNAFEEGLGFLKDGVKWAESQKLERLKLTLLDELIVWLIRLNRQQEAEQYASQYDLILKSANDFTLENSQHRMATRSIIIMLLEREDKAATKTLIEKLLARSQKINQQRKAALLLSFLAITEQQAGNLKSAEKSLLEAITIGASQGYYRLFIDEPKLHECLKRLFQYQSATKNEQTQRFLKQLIDKLPADSSTTSDLVEPLTSKEQEIIRLLEGGLTNKKIAEDLFISEGTLKWHLHNIYTKLQVKNRTQALIEGRKQGYL